MGAIAVEAWRGASERNIKRVLREARRYRARTVLGGAIRRVLQEARTGTPR